MTSFSSRSPGREDTLSVPVDYVPGLKAWLPDDLPEEQKEQCLSGWTNTSRGQMWKDEEFKLKPRGTVRIIPGDNGIKQNEKRVNVAREDNKLSHDECLEAGSCQCRQCSGSITKLTSVQSDFLSFTPSHFLLLSEVWTQRKNTLTSHY